MKICRLRARWAKTNPAGTAPFTAMTAFFPLDVLQKRAARGPASPAADALILRGRTLFDDTPWGGAGTGDTRAERRAGRSSYNVSSLRLRDLRRIWVRFAKTVFGSVAGFWVLAKAPATRAAASFRLRSSSRKWWVGRSTAANG